MKNPIIVALDVDSLDKAKWYASELAPHVGAFKIGKELFVSEGPAAVRAIQDAGGAVFLDLKFHDIPETVKKASVAAGKHGVGMFNVHIPGGREMLRAARAGAEEFAATHTKGRPLVLGVTVLTSLVAEDLVDDGLEGQFSFPSLETGKGLLKGLVLRRALRARECGLDGVVASPEDAAIIREQCGPDFTIVTPGVRPAWAAANDQKRVTTPKEAMVAGANYLVIGRPILKPPTEIGNHVDAAKRILEEINA